MFPKKFFGAQRRLLWDLSADAQLVRQDHTVQHLRLAMSAGASQKSCFGGAESHFSNVVFDLSLSFSPPTKCFYVQSDCFHSFYRCWIASICFHNLGQVLMDEDSGYVDA